MFSALISANSFFLLQGRYAFRLSVKVMCISEDGNLTDAAVLAVVGFSNGHIFQICRNDLHPLLIVPFDSLLR